MKLSVIVPCYNEEENIDKFYEVFNKEINTDKYELIFINDGSVDKTYHKIINLNKKDDRVKGINLSRNFGKDAAIYAGLKYSKGEYTAIIDADIQQNPKYLNTMLKYLDDNPDTDSVAMYADKRAKSIIINNLSKLFYKLFNKLSDTNFKNNASDFRMFRVNVKKAVLSLSEVNRFSKGIFHWVGFNTHYIPYKIAKRYAGKTSFTFRRLFKYGINGIVAFSVKPLAFATYTGFIASVISIIYFIYLVVKTLIFGVDVPGYASTLAIILFLGSIQLLSIGILGEYISKTYLESKERPIYIEKDNIGFSDNELL